MRIALPVIFAFAVCGCTPQVGGSAGDNSLVPSAAFLASTFSDACLAYGPNAAHARATFDAAGVPERPSLRGSYTDLPEYGVSEAMISTSDGQTVVNMAAFSGHKMTCSLRSRGLLTDEVQPLIVTYLNDAGFSAEDVVLPSDFEVDDDFDFVRTLLWPNGMHFVVTVTEAFGGGYRITELKVITLDPERWQITPNIIRDDEANFEITL